MRTHLTLALLVLALATTQSINALTVQPITEREENRQILLAMASQDGGLSAPKVVSLGSELGVVTTVLSASDAVEAHLDFLDQHDLRLAQLDANQATAAEPTWPLLAQIWFHEEGYYEMGSRCPTVTPTTVSEAEASTGVDIQGASDVGILETSVSEAFRNARGNTVWSFLQHWLPGQAPATNDAIRYQGWSLRAGFVIDFYCEEPASGTGRVQHDSRVDAYADRTDQAPAV